MHVLIVDDSRTMRSILRRTVTEYGCTAVEAEDGAQAVAAIEAGPMPDLCLVDWNMPVMDGLSFVSEVRSRKDWRSITLMMVTTESEHDQIVRALAAGAHEYLIKPFTADALIAKFALLGFSQVGVPS